MRTISILDFGAVPNLEVLQTEKIQAAIDCVFSNGGGEVCIPAGEYHITALRLRSNVCLHLMENAVLIASRNPEDYFILKHDVIEPVDEKELDEGGAWNNAKFGDPITADFSTVGSRWHNGIIRALHAENISIIGEEGSVIDGQNCFDELGEEHYRGPHGISIIDCNNVVLRGYTVRHSGNWANMLQKCTNIIAEDLIAEAGHDAIHFTICDNVTVRDCQFYTGDDCVAGFDIHNMVVERCVLNTACSAMRLGGTNILVQNCHVYAPAKYMFRYLLSDAEKRAGIVANDSKDTVPRDNMLSLFTYYADHSTEIRNLPGNITIRDCIVEGADRFLHFNYSGNEPWQNNRPLASITFENIKVVDVCMPLTAYGAENEPCNLTLKNVDLSFREGYEDTTFMHAANLKRLCMRNVTIRNAAGGQLVKLWGNILPEVEMEHVDAKVNEEYIMRANQEFVCSPI